MGACEFLHYSLSCRFWMLCPLKFWRVLLRGLQNPSPNPIFHLVWHCTKLSHLCKSVLWDHSQTAVLSVWHYLHHLLYLLALHYSKKLQTTGEFSSGGKLINMNAVNMVLLNPSSFFYTHTHPSPILKSMWRLSASSLSRLFGRSSLSLVSAIRHESQLSVKEALPVG